MLDNSISKITNLVDKKKTVFYGMLSLTKNDATAEYDIIYLVNKIKDVRNYNLIKDISETLDTDIVFSLKKKEIYSHLLINNYNTLMYEIRNVFNKYNQFLKRSYIDKNVSLQMLMAEMEETNQSLIYDINKAKKKYGLKINKYKQFNLAVDVFDVESNDIYYAVKENFLSGGDSRISTDAIVEFRVKNNGLTNVIVDNYDNVYDDDDFEHIYSNYDIFKDKSELIKSIKIDLYLENLKYIDLKNKFKSIYDTFEKINNNVNNGVVIYNEDEINDIMLRF